MDNLIQNKSEILFIYESTYNIPNGDPFTGEQRYDDETKKILISDVRIKRYIRDYLIEKGYKVFVTNDNDSLDNSEGSAASRRFKKLQSENSERIKKTQSENSDNPKEILLKCIDVRLFGGIVTIKNKKNKNKTESESEDENASAFNLTGPVQFALLSPSLNEIELRMHQNTSVFSSSETKKQGAIGTTTLVPYSINQIHGWINPYSAEETNLTNEDVSIMFRSLWDSINNVNTRSKSNQNSLLLIEIVYKQPNKKIYGLDRLIKIDTRDKNGDQLRSIDDFDFDFSKLFEVANNDFVEVINYYTEIPQIKDKFKDKFKEITFPEFKS